jgi:hypothetical protein
LKGLFCPLMLTFAWVKSCKAILRPFSKTVLHSRFLGKIIGRFRESRVSPWPTNIMVLNTQKNDKNEQCSTLHKTALIISFCPSRQYQTLLSINCLPSKLLGWAQYKAKRSFLTDQTYPWFFLQSKNNVRRKHKLGFFLHHWRQWYLSF